MVPKGTSHQLEEKTLFLQNLLKLSPENERILHTVRKFQTKQKNQ